MKRNPFYETETVTNTHPSQMKNTGQLQCLPMDEIVSLGKNSTGKITNQKFCFFKQSSVFTVHDLQFFFSLNVKYPKHFRRGGNPKKKISEEKKYFGACCCKVKLKTEIGKKLGAIDWE